MQIDIKLHKNDLPDEIKLDDKKSIAIDSEFSGLNLGRDKLYLVQISTGNNDAHIIQLNRENYDAPNLKQILEERDLLKYYSLYKLACSYPLVDSLLLPFLKKLDVLVIVEEKRGFLETELRELIDRYDLSLKIYGKTFKKDDHTEEGFPSFGGLSHEILTAKIEKVFSFLKFHSWWECM